MKRSPRRICFYEDAETETWARLPMIPRCLSPPPDLILGSNSASCWGQCCSTLRSNSTSDASQGLFTNAPGVGGSLRNAGALTGMLGNCAGLTGLRADGRINAQQRRPVPCAPSTALRLIGWTWAGFSSGDPQPGPRDPPTVRWTKVWGQEGGDEGGAPHQQSVLVARGNVLEVTKAFMGRVSLPGYHGDRYNATLALIGLRSSDAGVYHCEVTVGDEVEQNTVPLEVKGLVFHYRSPGGRYTLSFPEAQRSCLQNSALIATPAQLHAAFSDGYENCDAGWLSDQTVRYPVQSPGPGCYGDGEDSPGVRSYGSKTADELFDVYCFTAELAGGVLLLCPAEVDSVRRSLTLQSPGAELATAGQLFLAWQAGLDRCAPGWLADGSVRYPINQPRPDCGGDKPGVRTLYRNPNGTGYHDTSALFDAYCHSVAGAKMEVPPSPKDRLDIQSGLSKELEEGPSPDWRDVIGGLSDPAPLTTEGVTAPTPDPL
ncbi:hypothetical protein COCON_G00086790 [Conger conger]|uniref:Link domain-containing protein n=1 Tax=Conger conger TaxID=82655 RepID=A0A9Q1HYN4_CONCO|nr:hypothetical protein COCON_G00086790 [Conger conger]